MSVKQPIWPAGSQSMAVIFGTQGRDNLPGTDQDDVIRGWAEGGDPATDLGDVLRGLGGDDRLFGGGGRDRFLFAGGYDRDTITDFKDEVDTILLDGASLGVTSKAEALSLATVV